MVGNYVILTKNVDKSVKFHQKFVKNSSKYTFSVIHREKRPIYFQSKSTKIYDFIALNLQKVTFASFDDTLEQLKSNLDIVHSRNFLFGADRTHKLCPMMEFSGFGS